jgi:hypothetical protein
MKIYRFAVHPEEDGYLFLECINDPRLFTQARSMDEAVYMARDVALSMYGEEGVQVELVVPPDVTTRSERRRGATTKVAARPMSGQTRRRREPASTAPRR